MKKWLIIPALTIAISSAMINVPTTYAKAKIEIIKGSSDYHRPYRRHTPYNHNHREQKRLEEDARIIIHRTAIVLRDAQRAAYRRHYSVGLGKAVAHQNKARDLFREGKYRDAIYHSLHARDLAFHVIQGNRERCRPGYNWNDAEAKYRHDAPRDKDLDLRIKWNIHNDKEIIHLDLNFDLD